MRHIWWLCLMLCAIPALGQSDSSQCSPLPDAPAAALQPGGTTAGSATGSTTGSGAIAPAAQGNPVAREKSAPQGAQAQVAAAEWGDFAAAPASQQSADPAAAKPQADATQTTVKTQPGASSSSTANPAQNPATDSAANPATSHVAPNERQPKRILGFMPNYRAVSAGEIPPPPSARQAFQLATVNSFDYSAIVFGALTSMLAEGTNTHPDLGKGVPGFWAYNWRGFLDKTDGNYMVVFALPTLLHEDVRYYAMGHGGFKRREFHAASSVLIAKNYHGQNTFSGAEVFGRAIAQGLSQFYYPDHDNTMGALFARYGYSVGRDAITASFREFWPDIAVHILHRHP